MSENEDFPKILIESAEYEFTAKPHNSELINYAGELAMYDHMKVVNRDPDTGKQIGLYVFKTNKDYAAIRNYMIVNDYPVAFGQRKVDHNTTLLFEREMEANGHAEDFVPDDWAC